MTACTREQPDLKPPNPNQPLPPLLLGQMMGTGDGRSPPLNLATDAASLDFTVACDTYLQLDFDPVAISVLPDDVGRGIWYWPGRRTLWQRTS
jgi:hypothetical protein